MIDFENFVRNSLFLTFFNILLLVVGYIVYEKTENIFYVLLVLFVPQIILGFPYMVKNLYRLTQIAKILLLIGIIALFLFAIYLFKTPYRHVQGNIFIP